MRTIIVGAAMAVGTLFSLSSPKARANCEQDCNREYQACVASRPVAQCVAERNSCLSDCSGGATSSAHTRTGIKDQNGKDIVLGQSRPATLLPQQPEKS